MGAKGSRSKSVDITTPPTDDTATQDKKVSENGGPEATVVENSHAKDGDEKTENGEGGDGEVTKDTKGGSGDDSVKETVEEDVKVVSEKGDSGEANQEAKEDGIVEVNDVKESEKPADGETETEVKEEVEDADKKDIDKEDGKKDKKKDKKVKEKKDKKKEEKKDKEKKDGEIKKEKKKRSFSFLGRKEKKKEEESPAITVNGEVDHEDESKATATEVPAVVEDLAPVAEVSPVVEQAPVASPEHTETTPPIAAESVEVPKPAEEPVVEPSPAIEPPAGDKLSPPTNGLIATRISWEHGAKEVKITGSFSEWKDNIQLNASDDIFDVTVDLKQGEHHVKFCVDGNWTTNNNLKVVDVEGQGQVNLLVVGAPPSEE